MREFDLPLATASSTLYEAIAAMVDANKAGIVLHVTDDDIRLLRFADIVSAAPNAETAKQTKLADLPHYESVKTSLDFAPANVVLERDPGPTFFLTTDNGMSAALLSRSESSAAGYEAQPTATKCKRPNKPIGTKNADWYHYYPPEQRGNPPNICSICSAPLF